MEVSFKLIYLFKLYDFCEKVNVINFIVDYFVNYFVIIIYNIIE